MAPPPLSTQRQSSPAERRTRILAYAVATPSICADDAACDRRSGIAGGTGRIVVATTAESVVADGLAAELLSLKEVCDAQENPDLDGLVTRSCDGSQRKGPTVRRNGRADDVRRH